MPAEQNIDTVTFENYGPLFHLIGTWEGIKGDDIAPGDDRGTENNKYKERLVLTPIGMVNNHEQTLFALRYSTMAWRIGEDNSFHEEVGYWLWDSKASQIMKSFIVPRGITVLAGGTANKNDKTFSMAADLGSPTYGICSNQFLDVEFKTVRFELKITIIDEKTFSYESDTQLKMKGRDQIFHHTDKNTLKKV